MILAAMLAQVSDAQKGAEGYLLDSVIVETSTHIKQEKRVYEYDEKGRPTVCYTYYNRNQSGEWALLNKEQMTYNDGDILVKDETYRWNDDTATFTLVESTEVTEFDADNGQPSITVYSNYVSYEFARYEVKKYNGNLPEDLEIYQRDATDDEVWNLYANQHYEYDVNGNVTLARISIDYVGMFTLTQTVVYEYDEHGNVVKETSNIEPAELFGDEMEAESISLYQNEYDENGNVKTITRTNENGRANEFQYLYWSINDPAGINGQTMLSRQTPKHFDMTGRMLPQNHRHMPGIYIQNGRKYISH